MAFFEKKRKKRPVEAKWPTEDRYATEEDLKAMIRAKKIDKDLSKRHKVRNLAREKLEERKRRGREQGVISREDNVDHIPKHNADQPEIIGSNDDHWKGMPMMMMKDTREEPYYTKKYQRFKKQKRAILKEKPIPIQEEK